MKTKQLILVVILAFSAVLRLWHLGINPPALTPDEAALGYNAYSILKTGKDEYGTVLPIIFKSFGDYKPGLYVYAAVPSVALLGLTEFATRLPSAVAGIVAVWLVYAVVVLLDTKHKWLPLLGAFTLAVSPWHVHFSRGAWEVNLALTLTLAGIYFFLKSLANPRQLVWSALYFALTLIAYQGAKLSTLIVLVTLTLVYRSELVKKLASPAFRKSTAMSFVVGLIVVLPIIASLFTGRAGRLKVFSVFSYTRPQEYTQAMLDESDERIGDVNYLLFHSEGYNLVRGIFGRWFNHFSGRFLFFEGDWQNPRHSAPNQGEMQLADIAFFLIGLAALAQMKDSKFKQLVLVWLVLAPLPAALSRDQVHAVRALNMVVPLTLVSAVGLDWTLARVSQMNRVRTPMYLGIAGVLASSFIYFADAQFVHLPIHDSQYWEYGYKQVVQVVSPIANKYKEVHVRQSFAQPYIYFLFYQAYDPAKYQVQAHLIESPYGDVGRVERLDNYCFCPIDWTVNRGDVNTLFVADPIRIPPEDSVSPDEFDVVAEIPFLDGTQIAFRVVGVKER